MTVRSTLKKTNPSSLFTTAPPDLVAAAFSAAAMAALAMHYGPDIGPADIEQCTTTTDGGKFVWKATQTYLPGYGPLNGILDLSIIKAGFIGAYIGLALRTGERPRYWVDRAWTCRQLVEHYKRYGFPPEQIVAANRCGWGDILALHTLLMHYEYVIFATAIDLINGVTQTVDWSQSSRWQRLFAAWSMS